MNILPEWQELSQKIASKPGLTLLIGASDSGKTTLAKYLLKSWTEKGLKVAFVDCDMGQSTLGPPGTMGMRLFDQSYREHELLKYTRDLTLYFIGSFSPVGHLLQTLTGVNILVRKAQQLHPDIILVDTTGLVFGGVGEHLKYRKVELLRPNYVVLIQKSDELEHFNHFLSRSGATLYRLKAAEEANRRSPETRRQYRIERLKDYFYNAGVHRIPFPQLIIWGTNPFAGVPLSDEDLRFCSTILEGRILYGEKGGQNLFLVKKDFVSIRHRDTLKAKYNVTNIHITNIYWYDHRLVALYNARGDIETIAVIKHWDLAAHKIQVLGHLTDIYRVRTMEIGKENVRDLLKL